MNVLVPNTYLKTPYFTVRGEDNFTAYDLFVLKTRLQVPLQDQNFKGIYLQLEYIISRSESVFPENLTAIDTSVNGSAVNNGINTSANASGSAVDTSNSSSTGILEIGESTPAKTIIVEAKSNYLDSTKQLAVGDLREEGAEPGVELFYAIEEAPSIEAIYVIFIDATGDPKSLSEDQLKIMSTTLNDVLHNNPTHCALLISPEVGVSRNWWQQQVSYLRMPNTYSALYTNDIWLIDLSALADYSDVYQDIITTLNDDLFKSWNTLQPQLLNLIKESSSPHPIPVRSL